MKAAILALSGLLAVVTVPSAHADEWLPSKKGATLFGSIAAGVALGGPVGMLAGAAVGAWLNETLDDAAEVDVSREQLAQAKTQMQQSSGTVARLEHQLAQARDTSKQYAQLVLDQLELEMLFKTNATELTAAGQKRVARLADFLVANPQLEVRLDGYADPRGEDSYNQQLSLGRVSHVARMLMDFGGGGAAYRQL